MAFKLITFLISEHFFWDFQLCKKSIQQFEEKCKVAKLNHVINITVTIFRAFKMLFPLITFFFMWRREIDWDLLKLKESRLS